MGISYLFLATLVSTVVLFLLDDAKVLRSNKE